MVKMSFNDLGYLKSLGLEELYDPTNGTKVKVTKASYACGKIKNDLTDNDGRMNPKLIRMAERGVFMGEMTPEVFRKVVSTDGYRPSNFSEGELLDAVSIMRDYPQMKDERSAVVDYVTEHNDGEYSMITLNLAAGFALDQATLAVYPMKVKGRKRAEAVLTTVRPIDEGVLDDIIGMYEMMFKERKVVDNVLHEVYEAGKMGRIELDVRFSNDALRKG
jgi:hypothetical protein